jgi:hypothetical protein
MADFLIGPIVCAGLVPVWGGGERGEGMPGIVPAGPSTP